jgi:photosynthetic reaction center cytochrome c subunit
MTMKPSGRRLAILCGGATLSAILLGAPARVKAQAPAQAPTNAQQAATQSSGPGSAQTAVQKFKNIQVLKDIPADQLIPAMQFMSTSLGVECEFCHVEHDRDKDDKKTKQIARKMIEMMITINADNFDGERKVTCYSCHRGAVRPIDTPIIAMEEAPTSAAKANAPHEPRSDKEPSATAAAAALPDAKTILAKYLEAVGGADALNKITNRESSGRIIGMARFPGEPDEYPIKIISEAPEKRVSTVFRGMDQSVTAFNGQEGWLTTMAGVRPMSAGERRAARIDAEFYFPERLPQMYQDFKVEQGGEVAGQQTYLVSARGKDTPPLRLYFDQQTGLLLRLIRLAETPLGDLPTQIDYADYRDASGVKLPFRWTLARPGGQFTIQLQGVKSNTDVDEKLFVMPPPSGPPGPRDPAH